MDRRNKRIVYIHGYMNDDVASAVLTSPTQDHADLDELWATTAISIGLIATRNGQPVVVAESQSGNTKLATGPSCIPPPMAQFALLLIPKKNREHLVGDLAGC